jgi:wyosine [tRNA(Phe)-imidazoG37] synthetase (radical SAM superfamily)
MPSCGNGVPVTIGSARILQGIRSMENSIDLNELQHGPIIGGRVCTRTADRSLHVSFIPPTERRCTFDCLYCPFPRARHSQPWPRPGDIGTAVANALNAHPDVESITISGSGEPALHPLFGGALAEVFSGRRGRPDLPVRVVTNGTTLLEPRVRRLLEFADERIVRIDAGGARVSRPRGNQSLDAVAGALCELPDFSVESIFVDGPACNTNESDVEEWIAQLARLRPRRVYVTTIAEPPFEPTISRADAAALERIAEKLRRRTGITTTVLP